MKILEITISDSDFEYIQRSDKHEAVYAGEALKEKIAREMTGDINNLLKEGYIATAEEDLNICREYAPSEMGNL
ncbi:hypothetical protein [Dyadobacter sp. Leaf189]|uniref:hypothetical protein n=1 Tax=Dyadobacter sp. Leaf189 TaxID=1736295 RepID=UPI0006FC2107|nr:hypothetical protein [Dyadobacter sp. Leaf189]KQS26852.1 hypothetical protein ASG33_20120 [Dyadobacter sp. Leaf189]